MVIRRFVARTGLCVAALATIGGVAACEPAAPSLITDYKTTTTARLTTDGSDAYGSTSTPTGMVTSAPTSNTGANLRMVGFKKESPTSVNQEACATWTEGDAGISQPGVALRIAAAPSRVRAITVTNNILYGASLDRSREVGGRGARHCWSVCGVISGRWWRRCRLVGAVAVLGSGSGRVEAGALGRSGVGRGVQLRAVMRP